MNQDMELLQYIYQNTKMGENSLRTLLPRVEDAKLKSHLQGQLTGYSSLKGKAAEEIYRQSGMPQENSAWAKLSVQMGVRMNAFKDRSASHIAGMMIQGSTMGIVDMTQRLNQYKDAGQTARGLADEVVHFEQENIDRLKPYL